MNGTGLVGLSVTGVGDRAAQVAGPGQDDGGHDRVPAAAAAASDAGDLGWAQPHNTGRPLVLGIVASSTLITVLLLLPLPDVPRRWVVLGLLAVLFVLQGVLLARVRRAGRRPLSPMWLRVAGPTGWMWGFYTGFQHAVPILGYQSPLSSVLSGVFMGPFFGFIMWLADPGRRTRSERRTQNTSTVGRRGQA